jgi:hypothetical protein
MGLKWGCAAALLVGVGMACAQPGLFDPMVGLLPGMDKVQN